jgi:E3 ubiquitin-protein ligase CHFR
MEAVQLVSLNQTKTGNIEVTAVAPHLTIGRGADNDFVIPDKRCSSKHCSLTLTLVSGEDPQLQVEDLSSNGTFLNGLRVSCTQIGKNVTAQLQNGDTLSILRGTNIPDVDVIEYKVVMKSAKRKREAEEESPSKRLKVSSDLSDDLRCGICTEVIYQAVTLMPCLHNVLTTQFCGGCCSDWLDKSKLCPACRDPINEVKRNASLSSIIDTFLKSRPQDCRPQEELKELALKNKITKDSLIITARKKSFDSAGSASDSSEEEVKAPRGRIAIGKAPTTQRSVPAGKLKCRQCTKSVQGFKCAPTQQHILCSKCQQAMPQRPGTLQSCEGCQRHFCNLYWSSVPRCPIGVIAKQLMQLELYRNTTFTSMPPTALSENQFEQNVLVDLMRSEGTRFNDLLEAVLTDMTAGRWTPRLCRSYTDTQDVRLTRNSHICTGCAALLWNEMIYHYRDISTPRLPKMISGRRPCWYGKDCKTQKHNISHAQKLNHVCAPTPKPTR